jgi:hypothetical protein
LEEQGIGRVLAAVLDRIFKLSKLPAGEMHAAGAHKNKVACDCMTPCKDTAQDGEAFQDASGTEDWKVGLSIPCVDASEKYHTDDATESEPAAR